MSNLTYLQERQALKLKAPTSLAPRNIPRNRETKATKLETKGGKSETKPAKTGKKPPHSGKKANKPRMKKRSKKGARTMRKLAKEYQVFLASRPECRIKSPDCIFHATVVNHDRGRGANVHNQEDWTECCPPCNDYIEKHHEWARAHGFKKRRHGKKDQSHEDQP